MNKIYIIGNVTHTPESKTVTTASGDSAVCTFSVAVNKRNNASEFYRVTAWRKLGENCARFIQKGKKVAVVGEPSVRLYTSRDGETKYSFEITADEVEFLSPREAVEQAPAQKQDDFTDVSDDDLPF